MVRAIESRDEFSLYGSRRHDGIGHCAVIVVAGTSTELVQRYLNWNEHSRAVGILKAICGVLVLLGGAWLVFSAP